MLEEVLQQMLFLRLMADEYRLVDLLGRLGDGDFHFLGLIEDACGELLYLLGIVAENMSVWRSVGSSATMRIISS